MNRGINAAVLVPSDLMILTFRDFQPISQRYLLEKRMQGKPVAPMLMNLGSLNFSGTLSGDQSITMGDIDTSKMSGDTTINCDATGCHTTTSPTTTAGQTKGGVWFKAQAVAVAVLGMIMATSM